MRAVSTADIEWLNTNETAKRLGITPRTLYRFIDDGKIPAYRFGRVIRLKESEVAAFIEDSRFIDNAYGVYIEAQNASEIVVRNNVVAGGGNGIQVVGPAASKATIEDNLVAFHAGPGGGAVGDGIQVGGVQATLARNLVVGNTVGVKVVTGTAASRGDNIVRENGTTVSGSVATVGGI